MTNAAVLCSGKQQKTEPGVGRLVMVSAQDGSLPSLITPPQLTISQYQRDSNILRDGWSARTQNTQISTHFQGLVQKTVGSILQYCECVVVYFVIAETGPG